MGCPTILWLYLVWEVLNGVGVDGVGGIFPFSRFFFFCFFAFFFFFFFVFSLLFFLVFISVSFFVVFLCFALILLEDKGKRLQFAAKMGNFTPTPSAPTPCKTSQEVRRLFFTCDVFARYSFMAFPWPSFSLEKHVCSFFVASSRPSFGQVLHVLALAQSSDIHSSRKITAKFILETFFYASEIKISEKSQKCCHVILWVTNEYV